MAKERQKDEGAEMERGEKKKRRGRGERKVKIESEPPGHKATKRKASLLFD